jgi:hypothetical protein
MKKLVFESINEIYQVEFDKIKMISKIIQKYIPTFEVIIHENYGEIQIDGITTFSATGPTTINVILRYIEDIMMRLVNKNKI